MEQLSSWRPLAKMSLPARGSPQCATDIASGSLFWLRVFLLALDAHARTKG